MPEVRYSVGDDKKSLMAGDRESTFRTIEEQCGVEILTRTPGITIRSDEQALIDRAVSVLDRLRLSVSKGIRVDGFLLSRILEDLRPDTVSYDASGFEPILRNRTGQPIVPRTPGQALLVQALRSNDIVFANGPAGTGKTFLAVALAVAALEEKRVDRICLVRPAVEAGESLGYLPGDPKEKIAPYLRPVYDTLHELLPSDRLRSYQEEGAIEIAPLAYMRGRTLKRAFILLDEAQNTTVPQMMMFLTRLGEKSKVVVAGDSTQSDLGPRQKSGFRHAIGLLSNVPGIDKIEFGDSEVLRHPLVQQIVRAYRTHGTGEDDG